MSEIDELKAILKDDWLALCYAGDGIPGYETIEVQDQGSSRWESHHKAITRSASGKHYAWGYSRGLTEMQEDSGFHEDLVEVTPVERLITVTEYVEVGK